MLKIAARLGLVAVALSALAVIPASAACSGATLAANSAAQGSIDNGQTKSYKITVPAGGAGQLVLEGPNGDIDLSVKTCGGSEVCSSHNMVPAPDACVDEGTDTGIQDVGPALSAGTYTATISHCFSSKDGPNCDYAGDIAGVPGGLDDAPAVQYVLTFAAA